MKTIIQTQTNKRIVYSTLLAISLSVLAISYYRYLSRYQDGILPPLEKGTPFIYKSFKAEKGVVFHQPTGTHIVIPANALVDENGKKVKGKVTLKFREFQNAREIFLSGIPMQFGEDRNEYFSSAGMMELRVSQNNKPLKLASDKSVAVELASAIDPSSNYKLFKLEENKNWDNGTTFETVKNTRRDEALAALPARPSRPIDPLDDSTGFIFELISDYKRMPHLNIWKNVKWKFRKSNDELAPQEALRIGWDKIKIEPLKDGENTFKLDFSMSKADYSGKIKTITYSMIASPELTGRELAKATKKFEKAMENYAIEFAKIDEEENRLLLESGILNSFKLNDFGIFNIDCIKTTSILAKVNLKFDFEKELNPKINKVMLYLILDEERSVFKFNAFDWDKIPLTDSKCALVAVLPNGKVAYVSQEDFQKTIDFANLTNGQTFFFKTVKKEYEDMAGIFQTPSDESRLN
jgi:hypothetical protein